MQRKQRVMSEHGSEAQVRPDVPLEEYGQHYFESYNYADRPLGRFSMYWFARRYYAALARRASAVNCSAAAWTLLGLLQDDFACTGIDLAEYAVEQTRLSAPRAQAHVMTAADLSAFADGQFNAVVALHLVEHLPDPADTLRQVNRILKPGGLWLFTTPNPGYALRRFRSGHRRHGRTRPINVQPPEHGRVVPGGRFRVLRHFGDGLWDVPYFPVISDRAVAVLGLPALISGHAHHLHAAQPESTRIAVTRKTSWCERSPGFIGKPDDRFDRQTRPAHRTPGNLTP
jgi:SAM-dependent methyltransferase